MKTLITIILTVLFAPQIFAQTGSFALTTWGRGTGNAWVSDFEAAGINPANLGMSNRWNRQWTLGLADISFIAYSAGFTKSELKDGWLHPDNELTFNQKINAARSLAGSPLTVNAGLTDFGISANYPKIGGFAFRVQDVISAYTNLNLHAADQLYLGYNSGYFDQVVLNSGQTISQSDLTAAQREQIDYAYATNPESAAHLFDGSKIKALWYRAYNFSYGRIITQNDNMRLLGGVGVKYLQGFALVDFQVENGQIVKATSATSPGLGIDYGDNASTNPSYVSGGGLKPVGHGFGFDASLTLEVGEKTRLSLGATNIGSIKFDGNVHQAYDALVTSYSTAGVNSYNVFTQFNEFLGKDGGIKWRGLEAQTYNLPALLRLGGMYKINNLVSVGADVNMPLNKDVPGNIIKTYIGVGGDVTPLSWLRVSAGMCTGGNNDFQIPVGIGFTPGKGIWEAGFAIRDVSYFFTQNNPSLSFAMGFLTFRFGHTDGSNASRLHGGDLSKTQEESN